MFHSFLSIQTRSSYKQQIALLLLHGKQLEHNVANTAAGGHQGEHITKTFLRLPRICTYAHCLSPHCFFFFLFFVFTRYKHVYMCTVPACTFLSCHMQACAEIMNKMLVIASSAIRHLLIIYRCKSETSVASLGLLVVLTPLDSL